MSGFAGMTTATDAAAVPQSLLATLLQLQTPDQLVSFLNKGGRRSRRDVLSFFTTVPGPDAPDVLRNPTALSHLIESMKHDMRKTIAGTRPLARLAELVEACPETWPAPEVCRALSGLRYTSENAGVTALQTVLLRRLEACSPAEPCSASELSAALSGLRWSSAGRYPVVQKLFKALAARLTACREQMSVAEVSSALSGIRSSCSTHPGARETLEVLLPRLAATAAAVDAGDYVVEARDASEAMRGLCSSSSDDPLVCAALSALLPIFHACPDDLYSMTHSVGLLESFGRMSSDHAEVRAALLAVLPKVDASSFIPTSGELSRASLFLAHSSSDHAEVRLVLAALSAKHAEYWQRDELRPCSSSASDVAAILRRLGGCSSDHAEVRAFLREVTRHAVAVDPIMIRLNASEVINALAGLRRCQPDSAEVRALVAAFTPLVAAAQPEKRNSAGAVESQLRSIAHLRGSEPGGGDVAEVRALVEAVCSAGGRPFVEHWGASDQGAGQSEG